MKQTRKFNDATETRFHSSSFSEVIDNAKKRQPTELPALSHTRMEQLSYEVMFAESGKAMTKAVVFSARYLMIQIGKYNYSSLRRAQIGLVNKMSIERQKPVGSAKSPAAVYVVYSPTEISARCLAASFKSLSRI